MTNYYSRKTKCIIQVLADTLFFSLSYDKWMITIIWYWGWPSMGSLTMFLTDVMGIFSVRSLVPIQSWSSSSLKVSRTFPPAMFSIPHNGKGGSGSYDTRLAKKNMDSNKMCNVIPSEVLNLILSIVFTSFYHCIYINFYYVSKSLLLRHN